MGGMLIIEGKKEDSAGRFFVAAAVKTLLAEASPTMITANTGDRVPAPFADLGDKIRFANKGPRKGDKIGPSCSDDLLHKSWGSKPSHQAQGQPSNLRTNGLGIRKEISLLCSRTNIAAACPCKSDV